MNCHYCENKAHVKEHSTKRPVCWNHFQYKTLAELPPVTIRPVIDEPKTAVNVELSTIESDWLRMLLV